MGNAPRRAERLKRETIGGEEFTDALDEREPQERIPATLDAMHQQSDKIAKVRAINAQARAFTGLLRDLGSSRDFSIARQRIEEAAMWAARGVINERPAEKPQA